MTRDIIRGDIVGRVSTARVSVVLGRLFTVAVLLSPTSVALGQADAAAGAPAPVTADEAVAFGNEVQAAYEKGDVAAINALIDWDAFLELATRLDSAPTPEATTQRDQFRRSFKETVLSPAGLAASVVRDTSNGGIYRQLRSVSISNEFRPLFRIVGARNGSLNYHAWRLARRQEGKIKAVDIFIWDAGTDLSETVRQSFLHNSAVAKQAGDASFETIQRMNIALAKGKPQEVLEQYNSLPEPARKLKLAMSLRLRASAALSAEAYKAAVEEFRAAYPNNPTIDLLLIDGYALRKEFDKALASIDSTEKFVGGDGYLNVLRAGVLFQAGKADEALKAAQAAAVAEPETPFPYLQQFSSSVQAKDHAATLAALTQLRRLRRPIKDLTKDPLLADFVASPQFAEWQKIVATP